MNSFQQNETTRHEYRISTPKRTLFFVSGALAITIGIALFSYGMQPRHHVISAGLVSLTTTFLIFAGIFLLPRSFPARFVIDGSCLEASYFFKIYTIDISQIEGFYKSISFPFGVTGLRVRGTLQTLVVPNFLPLDDDFRALLQQLTDLDQQYKETTRNRIAEDQSLGNSPGERLERLESAKRTLVYLTLALLAAAAALYFGSVPIRVLAAFLLALAPLVPLLLLNRFPLLYAIFQPRTDPRANLQFPVFVASYCLFVLAFKSNVVSWLPLFLFATPITAAYIAAFARFDRSSKPRGFIRRSVLLVILAMLYGVGLVSSANTLLDRTQPTTYAVSVLSNQPTDNDYRKEILKLAPWGPIQKSNEIHVDSETLSKAKTTQRLCLALHPGFLRLAWYEPVPCPAQPASDAPQ